MSVLGGQILKSSGVDRGGIFDGVVYGDISKSYSYSDVSLDVDGFKLEFDIVFDSLPVQQIIYQYCRYLVNQYGGFFFQSVGTRVQLFVVSSPTAKTSLQLNNIALQTGIKYSFEIIKKPSSQLIKTTISSVLGTDYRERDLGHSVIYYQAAQWWGVGVRKTNTGALQFQFNGKIYKARHTEIDDSSVELNEMLNLNWNNGDATTVPNIGADKPPSSDMTWVPAGSGTYVDI